MGVQVANGQNGDILTEQQHYAVLVERLRTIGEAVEKIEARLDKMPTMELWEQLVKRSEFDRQTWEISQLRKDMERLAKETEDKIDANSPRRLWGNVTTIASGVISIIALLAALGIWKPH